MSEKIAREQTLEDFKDQMDSRWGDGSWEESVAKSNFPVDRLDQLVQEERVSSQEEMEKALDSTRYAILPDVDTRAVNKRLAEIAVLIDESAEFGGGAEETLKYERENLQMMLAEQSFRPGIQVKLNSAFRVLAGKTFEINDIEMGMSQEGITNFAKDLAQTLTDIDIGGKAGISLAWMGPGQGASPEASMEWDEAGRAEQVTRFIRWATGDLRTMLEGVRDAGPDGRAKAQMALEFVASLDKVDDLAEGLVRSPKNFFTAEKTVAYWRGRGVYLGVDDEDYLSMSDDDKAILLSIGLAQED